MSSPTVPPKTFSSFVALREGFSQAIAPGARLVTLGGGGATWWDGDAPVTATLPAGTPPNGARWSADGKSLRVGLGTLDLAARAWRAEPALAAIAPPEPDGRVPVREVAWLADAGTVAILLAKPAAEIVIASAGDGHVRGRHALGGANTLAASDNRVLAASADKVVLLDADANVVAEPTQMPLSVIRVREGGGMFAALGAAGDVALLRATDGVVLGKWDAHATDVVPIHRGAIAVDMDGNVRVACFVGGTLRQVSEAASGVQSPIVQLVGDRVVVAGAGADPVRVATFASPCG